MCPDWILGGINTVLNILHTPQDIWVIKSLEPSEMGLTDPSGKGVNRPQNMADHHFVGSPAFLN